MTKTKKRKGFTLTELAIVIAVIAILIAVLVPTFTSLITSANESADEQAVKSMNTALATDEALNGTPVNPSDAMDVLKDNGFNVENYVALDSNNVIYWDSSTNRTLLFSTSEIKVIYPSDAASTYETTDFSNDYIPNYWYTLSTAYETISDKDDTFSSCTTLESLISTFVKNYDTSKTLQLSTDYELTTSTAFGTSSSSTVDITIDLGENTLTTSTSNNSIKVYGNLSLRNGTIVDNSGLTSTSSILAPAKDSSITLENVNITSNGSVLYPSGYASQVNVVNSTIYTTGVYCIGTNASGTQSENVAISVVNSTLEVAAGNGDSCTIMINVAGVLYIENSTIIGQKQALLVRAGTATVTDSTINCKLYYTPDDKETVMGYSQGNSWSGGNNLAFGAIVVGDTNSGSYNADAILTLTGCTISCTTDDSELTPYTAAIYATHQDTTYATTVTLNDTSITNGHVVNVDDGATINGYTGYYTTWDSTNSKWTTGSSNN